MASIVTICGSPSPLSRTQGVLRHVADRLRADGHLVTGVAAREIPAAPLLSADTTEPAIGAVLDAIDGADALVVGTPVYKAAYTGLLKALLDLLPQDALADKAVLPLATGGSMAHILAIDYALRPVLVSLGAGHVSQGYFLLDRMITVTSPGEVLIEAAAAASLAGIVDRFSRSVGDGHRAGAAQCLVNGTGPRASSRNYLKAVPHG
jgi:FMN reductase